MITKTIEVRDSGTFIPMLAVKLQPGNDADRYLLARAGFGRTPESQGEYVMLVGLDGGKDGAACDPYDWPGGARTRAVAHQWLIAHFDEVESGSVVDVEFILGETAAAKISERFDEY